MERAIKRKPLCKCGNPIRSAGQGDCLACHAASMRRARAKKPMTSGQRRKASTRAGSRMLVKRGTIKRLPCFKCGAETVERHHVDYSNPRAFYWLCRTCRRKVRLSGEKLPKLNVPRPRHYRKRKPILFMEPAPCGEGMRQSAGERLQEDSPAF